MSLHLEGITFPLSLPKWTSPQLEAAAAQLSLPGTLPVGLEAALCVPRATTDVCDPLLPAKERLEFLGDAVIGYLVSAMLFRLLPEADEGTLSSLKAAIVSTTSLAEIGEGCGIATVLGVAESSRGRKRLIAATLEAIAGTLYLDQGVSAVQAWLGDRLEQQTQRFLREGYRTPKTLLQERTQRRGQGIPAYEVIEVSGPPHAREFTVDVSVHGHIAGRGKGHSRRAAEQEAAAMALSRLGAAHQQHQV